MLEQLNQRLLGRNNAQATCLALRIDADGAATLANAGHMPPYLNGELMPMEGALPLGMLPGAEFSVMRFKLKESDRLVLLSDGVVEAMDAEGVCSGLSGCAICCARPQPRRKWRARRRASARKTISASSPSPVPRCWLRHRHKSPEAANRTCSRGGAQAATE